MKRDVLRILAYRPEHQAVVRDLNLEWIGRHFIIEERDHRDLANPERFIIEAGGEIWVAELDGIPVGTCALLRDSGGGYELAKMAVAESARGKGVGRLLAETVIERARAKGALELHLFTNTCLTAAVALYRSLGFSEVPLGNSAYARANLRMVVALSDRAAFGNQ